MIGYASRTGTRSTIKSLSAAGWGWIVGPTDMSGTLLGGMRHAVDNGAWPAFIAGREIDLEAFEKCIDRHGKGADFIVLPDIVAGGMKSLELSLEWLPRLIDRPDLIDARLLIAVQDGMLPADIVPYLSNRVGIFVGGSTEWKLDTVAMWGRVKRMTGCYLHVGRVNTARRIAICHAANADSFDGTSVPKFPKTLALLDGARRQPDLFAA